MSILFKPIIFLSALALFSCADKKSPAVPETSENQNSEEEETQTAAYRLDQLGDSLRSASRYQDAIKAYQTAMDSAAVDADSFGYYDARLDLATVHDRLGELNTAIAIAEPIVDAYIRSGDSLRIGRAYSTLAAFYGRAHLKEKFVVAAAKGFNILKNHSSLVHRCAAYNQMAFVYSDMEQWNAALPLLDTALSYLKASRLTDLMPGILLNLGDCHRHLQHWPAARKYIGEAITVADSLGQIHVKAKALERLAQTEESENNPAKALSLYRQSKVIMDSLFTEEKARSLQQVEAAYSAKEKEQEIARLNAEKDKQAAQNEFYITLLILVLGTLFALFFRWRHKREKMQEEMDQRRLDLKRIAQILLEKNTRIAELENEVNERNIENVPANYAEAVDETGVEIPEEISNLRILTDNDWETFKTFFERTHPGFIRRLRQNYPQLTGAEERLLLLIKLNFSRQEMASTLGISPDSVKKGRQRLRKKLGLEKEEVLEEWIGRIRN